MAALARLFLLLVAAAFAWNLARGTERTWLRAKFLGKAGAKNTASPPLPGTQGPQLPEQQGPAGPQTAVLKTNVEVAI